MILYDELVHSTFYNFDEFNYIIFTFLARSDPVDKTFWKGDFLLLTLVVTSQPVVTSALQ